MPKLLFQKGQSGNPKGRPKKGTSINEILRDMIGSNEIKLTVTTDLPGKSPETKESSIKASKSMAYAINLALISKAVNGDVYAINTIYDRLIGKPISSEKQDKEGSEFSELPIEQKRARLISLFNRVA